MGTLCPKKTPPANKKLRPLSSPLLGENERGGEQLSGSLLFPPNHRGVRGVNGGLGFHALSSGLTYSRKQDFPPIALSQNEFLKLDKKTHQIQRTEPTHPHRQRTMAVAPR